MLTKMNYFSLNIRKRELKETDAADNFMLRVSLNCRHVTNLASVNFFSRRHRKKNKKKNTAYLDKSH